MRDTNKQTMHKVQYINMHQLSKKLYKWGHILSYHSKCICAPPQREGGDNVFQDIFWNRYKSSKYKFPDPFLYQSGNVAKIGLPQSLVGPAAQDLGKGKIGHPQNRQKKVRKSDAQSADQRWNLKIFGKKHRYRPDTTQNPNPFKLLKHPCSSQKPNPKKND